MSQQHDDFDDDRSVVYIGPRAFVTVFGALCLTLLGVTYGAARITEPMDDGAASQVAAVLPWAAAPVTAPPAPVFAPRAAPAAVVSPPPPEPQRAVAAAAPRATFAPVHRPTSATPQPFAPQPTAPQRFAPAPMKTAVAAPPHSAGLLVTLGASAAPLRSAALAPHAADASMMVGSGSHELQPQPALSTTAPPR